MKLQPRLLLATGTILAVFAAVSLFASYRAYEALLADEMRKEAEAIRGVLMATRRVYHQQFVASGLPVNDQTVGFLPAHALGRISKDFPQWNDSGVRFNNVSDRARNPANQADRFELEAMAWFRANPQGKEFTREITAADGQRYYHYTRPMWIEEYCLKCHGNRASAPESIAARYAEAYDYRIGDLRGVLSIKVPMAALESRLLTMWRDQAVGFAVGYALLFGTLAWMVRRIVTRRLARLEQTTRRLQAGDYTQRSEAGSQDEIGALAAGFNQMAQAVGQREAELRRFAEVTAHHLQEPARRMASYAERLTAQLAGRLDDAEARLSLDFIGQQARRQQSLLRDVERYLAAGQPRGDVGRVDTGALVARLLERMKPAIDAVGAQITVGDLPPVQMDAAGLADLFEVALDNALRHGGEKSRRQRDGDPAPAPLRIAIGGARVGPQVRYHVSDNGPGIEAEYRERVFRVFERLTPAGADAGTGIGLAIARRIAERCGGRAWIDETPGGGCRLQFELPAESAS